MHILRAKTREQNEESFDIKSLPKLQRAFLARRECGLCEQRLDRVEHCGAHFKTICCQETRNKRVLNYLKTYKPRNLK